jgi:DNA-binding transcriptional MerR regulator
MEVIMQKGWLSIKQISQTTGLSTFVIRKWEERYRCVEPRRLENGYRVYSERDLHRIISIKQLVDQGYTVKNALALISSEQPLPATVKPNDFPDVSLEHDDPIILNENVAELIKVSQRCDDKQIHHILKQCLHEHGITYLLNDVIQPFMVVVGDKWVNGEWSEHQEHIASMAVRDFLVQIRGTMVEPDHAPTMLATCLPLERHEIPMHLILVKARLKGWKTIFLGTSPAPGALEQAVKQISPKKVILSATTTLPFEEDPELLNKLESMALRYPHITFYLGGSGVWNFPQSKQLVNVKVTENLQEMLNFN